MEDRETPQIHKYGVSKTTRIMKATVRHVTFISERLIFVEQRVRLPLPHLI